MNNDGRTSERILADAIAILETWEAGLTSLDDCLDDLRREKVAHASVVSSLMLAYFRHKGLIDRKIHAFSAKIRPEIHRIAALTLTQCVCQTGIHPHSAVNVAVQFVRTRYGGPRPAGFLNALLRNVIRAPMATERPEAVLPPAVFNQWRKRFDSDTLRSLSDLFLSHSPPLTVRIPGNGTSFREAVPSIEGLCRIVNPEWAGPMGFHVIEDAGAFFASSAMETGLVYVQDPASAAFLNLPLPDTADVRQILDLCSAPGGKSILLAERYPNASLICSDRSAKRLNRVAENFNQAKRRDIRFPALTVCDARKPPFQTTLFDLVLLDVPCSNTGVFRRRPDALWRFHPKRLAELVRLQAEILQAASDLLRPGGFIIYSTCSIEPDENTRQIRSFLDSHSDYSRILDIEFVPDTMHDGVYAALLKRN